MTQPNNTMDFERTHARSLDPGTSHAAAASMVRTAQALIAIIFDDLREHGPGTHEQISMRTGLRPDQVWRRLSDMERQGLATPTDMTAPGSSGRQQRIWKML